MPDTTKKKLSYANVQPEYIPPAKLVKCPFEQNQKFFWLETAEWFRAHHRFNEAAKFDDDRDEMRENYGTLKKAVPEKFLKDVWRVRQSVFHAFNFVQSKGLGMDTEDFPKGAVGRARNGWLEQKKKAALYSLKCGFALWSPQVEPGLLQAIHENDKEFFRREIPETLNGRRKVVCFDPEEPSGETLEHWLVSFWCPGDYWPSWADSNFPPFCLFTQTALTNFLSIVRITDVKYDRVNAAIKELGLVSFKGPGRIKAAMKQGNGRIILKPF
jgi:hypothetical protein